MKTADIIKAVKRHKGDIFAEVSLCDDILLVQVAKTELLFRLETIDDGQAAVRTIGGGKQMVFGKAYGEEDDA